MIIKEVKTETLRRFQIHTVGSRGLALCYTVSILRKLDDTSWTYSARKKCALKEKKEEKKGRKEES